MGDTMNILITGGTSGIAGAVIDKLKNKHEIFVATRTEKEMHNLEKKYSNYDSIYPIKLDVTNTKDYNQLSKIDIDVLICNAAIGYSGSILEIPLSLVRENFEVNVFSNIQLVQIIFQKMLAKGSGKIIFISSLAGYAPIPFLGTYCATKSSLNILSQNINLEAKLLNKNIKIINVLPGLYYTGFNQVMTENKFARMHKKTYFKKQLPLLEKYETPIYHLLEKKNVSDITNKIVTAVTCKNPKSIYRTRPTQILATKLYQIFFT